ncbi:MAG TPA: hypothetical protein VK203_19105, partial [Nostocaceae cyanobacterium]|nr:hypothetical protein [Nostocaceae cyanobacterium]
MINLTPNWKQIKLNHPDVHIALEYVASAIYQNQEDAILVSQEDELKLNSALAFGSLTKINNKVAFSEPNIKFEYLARYAASLALEAWDDLYRFYEIFKEIYHHSFRLSYNYEICNIVLLILNQEHQKDITSCLTEELQENQEVKGSGIFWIIVTPFCQVLPSLHFEPKLLAEKLEILLRCMA